jgi:hypothetical protein
MKTAALSPDALRVAARNVVLLREAEAIASALADLGIRALFLKGAALLEGQPAMLATREMADIDVWVEPRDLGRTVAALHAAGYVSPANALVLRKHVGTVAVYVDLHGELWYFEGKGPWSRAVPAGPTGLRTLGPEDAALHAILHSVVQDGRVSPRALEDCRAILADRGARFRWEAFAATVVEEGWEKPVALFLSRLEAAYPGTVPAAAGVAWTRIRPEGVRPWRGSYLRMLQLQSRWPRKVRLARRVLFPHPEFLRLRYSRIPPQAAFLLPLLRPFLLLARLLSGRVQDTQRREVGGQRPAGTRLS